MLGFWITVAVFLVIIASLVAAARRKDRLGGQGPRGDGSAGVRVSITDPPYLRPVEEIRAMPQHLPDSGEISPESGPADAARP